jgi:hypothetical protein
MGKQKVNFITCGCKKFSTTVMNGYVALEIAIGHKLGLFSALKKFNSPVTSHELADSCKLKER